MTASTLNAARHGPRRNVIAIAYDFDGTLSPQPMQEYTVLPKLREKPEDFWKEVNREAKRYRAEKMLTYMRLLLEKAQEKKLEWKRDDFHEDFRKLSRKIKFFPGVDNWFGRINKFVQSRSEQRISVQHYIISSGLLELLEGISIFKHFKQVYASEYHYDHNGIPTFPKVLITDTAKTQYLFRINKGLEDPKDSINEHMPEEQRPIPFSNIIYVGDGSTDVPSMTVTRDNGGHSLAVYREDDEGKSLKICRKLLKADRVDLIAPADFRGGKALDSSMKMLLAALCQNMMWQDWKRDARDNAEPKKSSPNPITAAASRAP